MITATKLQSAYNRLYSQIRKYIWDFETVNALADLEIIVYQTFPDMSDMSDKFNILKRLISYTDVFGIDEELKQSFDNFQKEFESDTDLYAGLTTFKEVVVV